MGEIDVVLISHVHGDHLGDRRIAAINEGSCAEPQTNISTTPNSNSVDIAIDKNACILVGSEMASFLANKVARLGGDPESVQLVRFGASRTIDSVIASHANEAATRGGRLQPETKTARFIDATETSVYLPLSGKTLSFDADGFCTDGCA